MANVAGVTLRRNTGQALAIAGARSKVTVRHATIEKTGNHPDVPAMLQNVETTHDERGFGAVRVYDGALLRADGLTVTESRLAGVAVADGARARLENVKIRDVAGVAMPNGRLSSSMGVHALRGAQVDLRRFSVEGAMVGLAAVKGFVRAEHGRITDVEVGASFRPSPDRPRYGPSCMMIDVKYMDVGIPLQATRYELPSIPSGGAEAGRWCPIVP